MPARGCPLPTETQPRRCRDCPLSEPERERRCKWYRGLLNALSPFHLNLVSNGVLLFTFSITILSFPGVTDDQRYIAYASLVLSSILAVLALLHRRISFLTRNWVVAPLSMLVFVAWFFGFAMKWLDGLKNTKDLAQAIVSGAGVLWLFCLLMVLTRGLSQLLAEGKFSRWVPLGIPLLVLWQTVTVFQKGNVIGGLFLVIFVVGSALISVGFWRPIGEMPIGPSR